MLNVPTLSEMLAVIAVALLSTAFLIALPATLVSRTRKATTAATVRPARIPAPREAVLRTTVSTR